MHKQFWSHKNCGSVPRGRSCISANQRRFRVTPSQPKPGVLRRNDPHFLSLEHVSSWQLGGKKLRHWWVSANQAPPIIPRYYMCTNVQVEAEGGFLGKDEAWTLAKAFCRQDSTGGNYLTFGAIPGPKVPTGYALGASMLIPLFSTCNFFPLRLFRRSTIIIARLYIRLCGSCTPFFLLFPVLLSHNL